MKAWLLLIVAASAFPNLPCDLCKDTVGLLQKAVTANKLMIDLVEDVIKLGAGKKKIVLVKPV